MECIYVATSFLSHARVLTLPDLFYLQHSYNGWCIQNKFTYE